MTLAGIIVVMLLILVIGRSSRKVGLREYLVLLVLTALQVGVTVFDLLTKQSPR